jgi:hypothetical protein
VIPRDRFGTLRVDESGKGPGDYQLPEIRSEFITNEIEITKQPRFYLNADGLGAEASLKIELLNDREQPLPGYTAKVQSNGFQTPVVWQQNVSPLPDRIHIRVTFEGAQNTAIRFSALYIRP